MALEPGIGVGEGADIPGFGFGRGPVQLLDGVPVPFRGAGVRAVGHGFPVPLPAVGVRRFRRPLLPFRRFPVGPGRGHETGQFFPEGRQILFRPVPEPSGLVQPAFGLVCVRLDSFDPLLAVADVVLRRLSSVAI